MDDKVIAMLTGSFSEVATVRDAAAKLFYERLFTLDPSLKAMFANTDMDVQGAKLMAALALVVNNLRHFETVQPVLAELAVRHEGYGVKASHYQTVGTALIETLALFFGDRFTPELRAAWTGAYGAVSSTMLDATRRPGLKTA